MPIGGGIVPATGSTQYTELTYVTRGHLSLSWSFNFITLRP
jgi:hypothetical protein